jgi:uncharacterized protein YhbP (UPF0306 family)
VSLARLQGIQFTGRFFKPDEEILHEAKKIYLRKIPAATFMPSSLWGIEVDFIKMTDNALGFGRKLTWSRGYQTSLYDLAHKFCCGNTSTLRCNRKRAFATENI